MYGRWGVEKELGQFGGAHDGRKVCKIFKVVVGQTIDYCWSSDEGSKVVWGELAVEWKVYISLQEVV